MNDLLPRMPGAGWEGWFCIAIPRRGSPVRFTKTHLFRASESLRLRMEPFLNLEA